MIRLQPLQRTLAGRDRALARSIARQHLRDEEQAVAPSRDRIRNDELGIAIHLGGGAMGHALVDAALKRRNRTLAVAAVEIPGAPPHYGNPRAAVSPGDVAPRRPWHCQKSQ